MVSFVKEIVKFTHTTVYRGNNGLTKSYLLHSKDWLHVWVKRDLVVFFSHRKIGTSRCTPPVRVLPWVPVDWLCLIVWSVCNTRCKYMAEAVRAFWWKNEWETHGHPQHTSIHTHTTGSSWAVQTVVNLCKSYPVVALITKSWLPTKKEQLTGIIIQTGRHTGNSSSSPLGCCQKLWPPAFNL